MSSTTSGRCNPLALPSYSKRSARKPQWGPGSKTDGTREVDAAVSRAEPGDILEGDLDSGERRRAAPRFRRSTRRGQKLRHSSPSLPGFSAAGIDHHEHQLRATGLQQQIKAFLLPRLQACALAEDRKAKLSARWRHGAGAALPEAYPNDLAGTRRRTIARGPTSVHSPHARIKPEPLPPSSPG